ncbi:MAG: hypothetical protein LC772_01825 [Chloroflexi bacterium]|nr:hypothetical protein [Chloroflexota bacterium]
MKGESNSYDHRLESLQVNQDRYGGYVVTVFFEPDIFDTTSEGRSEDLRRGDVELRMALLEDRLFNSPTRVDAVTLTAHDQLMGMVYYSTTMTRQAAMRVNWTAWEANVRSVDFDKVWDVTDLDYNWAKPIFPSATVRELGLHMQ